MLPRRSKFAFIRVNGAGGVSDIDGQTDSSNGALGRSDIEGKAAMGSGERAGKRTSFKWAGEHESIGKRAIFDFVVSFGNVRDRGVPSLAHDARVLRGFLEFVVS
jgi:hypothetical protein